METDSLELQSFIDKQLIFDGRSEEFAKSTINVTLDLTSEDAKVMKEESELTLELRDWP